MGALREKNGSRKEMIHGKTMTCLLSDVTVVYVICLLSSVKKKYCSIQLTLCITHIKRKTFGHRPVSYCAPKQWNSLPSDICHIQSSHAFKPAFTMHLNRWFQILSFLVFFTFVAAGPVSQSRSIVTLQYLLSFFLLIYFLFFNMSQCLEQISATLIQTHRTMKAP